jgi:hypothetical protein
MLKRLPSGESSFDKIRSGDQLYVDKTRQLYELLCSGDYFFLSRPRRFGKSLTVSTLKALFEGREELFEGLWIHERWDWAKKNPVLSLSFNGLDYTNQPLEQALVKDMELKAAEYDITLAGTTSKERFRELILALASKGQVAVLIDEYDKPINDFLDDYAQADANRDLLANFFGALKANDVVDHLRFVFITGVSKFSKVTLFSELNNLTDLTHHDAFSTLLGITQAELEQYFAGHIASLADKMGITPEALLAKIKYWYNGYTWDGEHFLYNPFSLLGLFGSGAFKNFWFTTGTTSWLVRQMRAKATDVVGLEGLTVEDAFFDKFDIRYLDPAVLLYQTGYLTIKTIKGQDLRRYTLGYPNFEVRHSLMRSLFTEYAQKPVSESGPLAWALEDALADGDLPQFIALLRGIFADISNRLLKQYVEGDSLKLWEAYYQTVVYLALNLTGSRVACEVQTNKGYIDAVAEAENHIYVMEFKVGKAAEAMQQIKGKGYHEKYRHRNKPITLLGVGFDPEARNTGDWEEEALESRI